MPYGDVGFGGRTGGILYGVREKVHYHDAVVACPQCGQEATRSVCGPWGEWQLFEGFCVPCCHYWCYDVTVKMRDVDGDMKPTPVLPLGYRLDRTDGLSKKTRRGSIVP